MTGRKQAAQCIRRNTVTYLVNGVLWEQRLCLLVGNTRVDNNVVTRNPVNLEGREIKSAYNHLVSENTNGSGDAVLVAELEGYYAGLETKYRNMRTKIRTVNYSGRLSQTVFQTQDDLFNSPDDFVKVAPS